MKAVMRRTAVVESPGNNVVLVGKINKGGANVISYEGIEVDLDSKGVMVDGCEVAFTKREFELLKLFIENPNKVFSREEILKLVWHDDVCVLDRTVDVNITRVRKKIGRYGSNLVSRQGYGYCFKS